MEEMSDLTKQRLNKLESLRAKGLDPYRARFKRSSTIGEIINNFVDGKEVCVAGRIMATRTHGKSIFSDLKDETAKVQLYVNRDIIGQEEFSVFEQLDIGDIIGTSGPLFKTMTGQMSIKVSKFSLLAKSLRPLPEKWHGLKDVETRYRQRHLDLIANEKVREVFILRSRIISKIREFLDGKGYLEVETPMMQPIPGGATGKPFKTYHEALGTHLYLRIAPEIYLKKLLVGGFEKIYEINRSFRNEGISSRHNPEFTMLEVYTAFSDYEETMQLTEELISFAAQEVLGKRELVFQGQKIDLARWERRSFADMMKERFDITPEEDLEGWIDKLNRKGIKLETGEISRTFIINLIGELLEPKANPFPIFVTDLFTELCPLAKTKGENPLLTERFELYIGGLEIANAYSELNDPQEQRRRFEDQIVEGTEEAMIDEDYLLALEYGMPPAGGLGIGVDRLVMLFANQGSIRDVILFPQLKPEK